MTVSTFSARSPLVSVYQKTKRALTKVLSSLAHSMEAQSRGEARLKAARRLLAKSDAELRAMGLTRTGITREVFGKFRYL